VNLRRAFAFLRDLGSSRAERIIGSAVLFVLIILSGCAPATQPAKSSDGKMSGGPARVMTPAPNEEATAKRLFKEECANCHLLGGVGEKNGMPLDHDGGVRSQAWIEAQIRRPDLHNPKTLMPLFPSDRLSDSELHTLAHYLASLK